MVKSMRTFQKFRPKIEYLSYEELESVVQAHRSGDSDATERLIGSFWLYIQKYVQLICFGKADITDKEIRNFIGLFMPKEKSSTLYQFRKNAHARHDMYKAVARIESLFHHVKKDEIEHELVISLLTLAGRYKSHGNYFHTYVQRAFHFQIQRQLKSLLEIRNIPYFDEAFTDEGGEFGQDIDVVQDPHFLIEESLDEINDNWVNGLTASDAFFELTRTQRRILKLYYIDEKTDEEISDLLGVCRVTVNRRRQKAIHAVEPQLMEQNLLKVDGNEDNSM
jgi:RNA polymerase sigma factor (sigma-70 family)